MECTRESPKELQDYPQLPFPHPPKKKQKVVHLSILCKERKKTYLISIILIKQKNIWFQ